MSLFVYDVITQQQNPTGYILRGFVHSVMASAATGILDFGYDGHGVVVGIPVRSG